MTAEAAGEAMRRGPGKYRSVVVGLLLLAGGCTGLGIGTPAPEALKAIEKARTVGVISAVGDKFALQKIGVTVLGNELNQVGIDSWAGQGRVTAAWNHHIWCSDPFIWHPRAYQGSAGHSARKNEASHENSRH
jgi:hypothetical protein